MFLPLLAWLFGQLLMTGLLQAGTASQAAAGSAFPEYTVICTPQGLKTIATPQFAGSADADNSGDDANWHPDTCDWCRVCGSVNVSHSPVEPQTIVYATTKVAAYPLSQQAPPAPFGIRTFHTRAPPA